MGDRPCLHEAMNLVKVIRRKSCDSRAKRQGHKEIQIKQHDVGAEAPLGISLCCPKDPQSWRKAEFTFHPSIPHK